MLGAILDLSLTSWLVVIVLATVVMFYLRKPRNNLPPSPAWALPIVGHLYLLGKNPRKQFLKWSRALGEIFTLQMGANTVVVLSSYDVLKEALVKQADHFSDRPLDSLAATANPDSHLGVLFSSGALWKEQRTAAMTIMREFGMGKNILAEKISEEVSFYILELAKLKGKPSNIRLLTQNSVSNVISAIIFGKRFEFGDKRFERMLDLFDNAVKVISGVAYVNYFPFLRKLPFDIGGSALYKEYNVEIRDFCNEFVQEEKRKNQPESGDNFIASYLEEMNRRKMKGQDTTLDEHNLVRTIHNLFAAGTETTSTTMLWFFLYCMHYPKIQEKIYKEIVDEVGLARVPNISDRLKLKYLNATILETQRFASIVPFSLQHICSEDTKLYGYDIPKGTQIVPHLDSVLMDKKIWINPETFSPERFFDKDGNLAKFDEFIPFSIGRRICMGEALAKMELFLYLSTVVQRFKFVPEDPNNLPPLKDQFGVTCPPENYMIRCIDRQTLA